MTSRPVIRWAGMLGMMSLAIGCGQAGRSPLGKVTGLVTYQGEPLESAVIVFHNPRGRSAIGQVIEGNIEGVTTYDTLNDGAAIGTLTVTIHPDTDREAMKPKPGERQTRPAKPPFPLRYCDPKTSKVTVEIHAGVNEVALDLTD